MDLLKNLASGSTKKEEPKPESHGIMDSLHGMVGGGRHSEKKEDALDKVIDLFQEKVLGQGPQDNESAIEQHKDEMISDLIRGQYKKITGSELGIKDK